MSFYYHLFWTNNSGARCFTSSFCRLSGSFLIAVIYQVDTHFWRFCGNVSLLVLTFNCSNSFGNNRHKKTHTCKKSTIVDDGANLHCTGRLQEVGENKVREHKFYKLISVSHFWRWAIPELISAGPPPPFTPLLIFLYFSPTVHASLLVADMLANPPSSFMLTCCPLIQLLCQLLSVSCCVPSIFASILNGDPIGCSKPPHQHTRETFLELALSLFSNLQKHIFQFKLIFFKFWSVDSCPSKH